MEKIILVDGKQIKFKSTAGTLMRYRNNFGRDLIKDIIALEKKFKNVKSGIALFEIVELDMFEKIAWSMAKTANNEIPDIEHWLDSFDSFSIMKVLPDIMELLIGNLRQENEQTAEKPLTAQEKTGPSLRRACFLIQILSTSISPTPP